jgi:hypothetical protein
MVEAGESEYSELLKPRKLLKNKDAKRIWNVEFCDVPIAVY